MQTHTVSVERNGLDCALVSSDFPCQKYNMEKVGVWRLVTMKNFPTIYEYKRKSYVCVQSSIPFAMVKCIAHSINRTVKRPQYYPAEP